MNCDACGSVQRFHPLSGKCVWKVALAARKFKGSVMFPSPFGEVCLERRHFLRFRLGNRTVSIPFRGSVFGKGSLSWVRGHNIEFPSPFGEVCLESIVANVASAATIKRFHPLSGKCVWKGEFLDDPDEIRAFPSPFGEVCLES